MTATGLLAGAAAIDYGAAVSRYAYRVPGAYIELPRARRAITPRRTDIAGFVGIARRGPVGLGVRVESWAAFVAAFGAHTPAGYLAYAAEAFYANGGRTLWVVRMASGSARPATVRLLNEDGRPAVELTAAWTDPGVPHHQPSQGTWAHAMTVTVTRDGDRFDLTLRDPAGLTERWRDLDVDGRRPIVEVLGDTTTGSQLASAQLLPDAGAPLAPAGPAFFADGADGLADLEDTDVAAALACLERIDEVAIVAVPDLQAVPRTTVVVDPPAPRCDDLSEATEDPPPEPPAAELPAPLDVVAGQREMIAQCERTRDRFAVLDPPLTADDPASAMAWCAVQPSSSYAASYFPWILAPDPLRLNGELVRRVPPSGHVVGVYAQRDRTVGVHAPPANVALDVAADVAFAVDDGSHGDANDACLNIIRAYDGRGIRIMGARTLACRPPWRFVSVRRLVAMVQEAVTEDLAWAVFESNNPTLWAEVDRHVRGFLDGLWQAGMLDGAKAAEAFDVRCDADTNPPDEIAQGRLTCLIALRSPAPAEFVIVRVTLAATGAETTLTGVPGG